MDAEEALCLLDVWPSEDDSGAIGTSEDSDFQLRSMSSEALNKVDSDVSDSSTAESDRGTGDNLGGAGDDHMDASESSGSDDRVDDNGGIAVSR